MSLNNFHLGDKIDELSQILDGSNEASMEVILQHYLINAFYLGYGWIYPDGSWTPGGHWGGRSDFRHATRNMSFHEIQHSQNLQSKIDEFFQKGRQYFTDDEYNKLPLMFRLLFLFERKKSFNKQAMEILDDIRNNVIVPLQESDFPSILKSVSSLGYASENSYTQAEKDAMERKKQQELEREERKKQAERDKQDQEEKTRIYQLERERMHNGLCPKCGIAPGENGICPGCGWDTDSIPF